MSIWVAVITAGVLCFVLRFAMVAFLGRVDIPDRVALALRYVAPATMSALLVTTMMTQAHTQVNAEIAARVVALAIAVVVAVRTRSHLITIAVGMPALWLASVAFGA